MNLYDEYLKGTTKLWYIREAWPVQVGCITYVTFQRKMKNGEVFKTYEECCKNIDSNYKRKRYGQR